MPTAIEWTDESWNPVRARNKETGKTGHFCVHKSPGCANCYAERMQPFLGNPVRYAAQDRGKVDLFLDEKELLKPLRWRKPRMVFPCSMTDLFAGFVPEDWIDRIVAVMGLTPHLIYQPLTKRPERMREYFAALEGRSLTDAACEIYLDDPDLAARLPLDIERAIALGARPLKNIWLGTSVEDQQRADERIPPLLDTPAALRWISAEPLLSEVDFSRWLDPFRNLDVGSRNLVHRGMLNADQVDAIRAPILNWLVVGGESGPRARPFDIGWARSIIAQCRAANVPVFMKQLGRIIIDRNDAGFEGCGPDEWPEGTETEEDPHNTGYQGAPVRIILPSKKGREKGGVMSEWPPHLRVRDDPPAEFLPREAA